MTSVCFASTVVYKAVTTLGPVERPLTPNTINSICKEIYRNLTAEALQKLDISVDNPFLCESNTEADTGNKTIVITTYVEAEDQ